MSPKTTRNGFTLIELIVVAAIILVLVFLIRQSTPHCIVAGTPIDTPYGARPIESLEIGDEVLSRASDGEIQTVRIIARSEHSVPGYLLFVFEDGEMLRTTSEHPIATTSGWKNAGELRVKDFVIGKLGPLEITAVKNITRAVEVYDLTVEPNSNFYASGVLVHNKSTIIHRSMVELKSIEIALVQYQEDFRSYPPDGPGKDGSEILYQYLCHESNIGSLCYGPYLKPQHNGELVSPFGGRYTYKILEGEKGPRALVIDPGKDKLLGGTIDPKKGFVPDGSGADKDNLYSIDPASTH